MAILSYDDGKYQVDTDKLFAGNFDKLAQRTFSHIMGNECHSAVPESTEDLDNARHAWRVARIEKLMSEALGTRAGGPRIDPVEAKVRQLVDAKIRTFLKKCGVKQSVLKDGGTFEIEGQPYTFDAMRQAIRQSAGFEKIEAEARRAVNAEARLSKADGGAGATLAGLVA